MKEELNLKIIDTPEKAFLIGLANCQGLYYWKSNKDFLLKNILEISFSLSESHIDSIDNIKDKYHIMKWFKEKFGKYLYSINYIINSCNVAYINVKLYITEDSKNNLQCKYVPIKKSLYDYYIRGMFYNHSFEKEIPFKNYVSNTIDIIGPISLVETLSKKLNDYYNLTDFEISYHQNSLKFASLQYAKNEQNIKYFKNIWSCTENLINE